MKSGELKIDLPKLSKESRRSWKKEIEGKKVLGIEDGIADDVLPFFSYKNQIERAAYIQEQFFNNSFRYEIAKNHVLEAKLLFVMRYKWFYKRKNRHPFDAKWVYNEYKVISSELEALGLMPDD